MIVATVRLLVTIGLGFALWAMWQRLPPDPRLRAVIALGFVSRAVLGSALYFVSFFHLPIARSLQIRDGLWFFGVDGLGYFDPAVSASLSGLGAVLGLDTVLHSPIFTATLSLFLYLCGPVASVALLLNALSFLGVCLILVHVSRRLQTAGLPLLLAISVTSVAPGSILWALQPMKEPFFVLLLTGFIAALLGWSEATSSRTREPMRTAVLSAVWLTVCLYGMAGVRWYFALLLLGAMIGLWPWLVIRARGRRLAVAVAGLALILVLDRVTTLGMGSNPSHYAVAFSGDNASWLQALHRAPSRLKAQLDTSRAAVFQSPGSTTIMIPTSPDPELARAPAAAPPGAQPQPAPASAKVPETTREKFRAGAVAMWVPGWLAMQLGWIKIEGGRGLLAFADVDTIVFDFAILASLALVVRALRRGGRPHPVFWHVSVTLVVLTGLLLYVETNLGTMFRQRGMIAAMVVLLPLLIATRAPARPPAS